MGFDLSNSTIPVAEIFRGGPPPDGIPSIDNPRFIRGRDARHLKQGDRVISITIGEETRAYPLRILVWHEIVNDEIDGVPIAVTYCPLCGTSMVFDRRIDGKTLEFGVSGLLHNSDLLMYDRQTKSLWSQLGFRSISGPMAGTELPWRASEHSIFGAWKEKYSQGKVLAKPRRFQRDYSRDPHPHYKDQEMTMFPLPGHRRELKNKAWVAGIIIDGQARAYPLGALPSGEEVKDQVGGVALRVIHEPATQRTSVTRASDGSPVPYVHVYWFAWQAFYPETTLWPP